MFCAATRSNFVAVLARPRGPKIPLMLALSIYFSEFNGRYFSLVKLKEETRVIGGIQDISSGHYAVLRERKGLVPAHLSDSWE